MLQCSTIGMCMDQLSPIETREGKREFSTPIAHLFLFFCIWRDNDPKMYILRSDAKIFPTETEEGGVHDRWSRRETDARRMCLITECYICHKPRDEIRILLIMSIFRYGTFFSLLIPRRTFTLTRFVHKWDPSYILFCCSLRILCTHFLWKCLFREPGTECRSRNPYDLRYLWICEATLTELQGLFVLFF